MASSDEEYQVLGANTRYSSWTARVAVVLDYFQVLHSANYYNLSEVRALSPTGFVPILRVSSPSGQFILGDSLSICEFLAESHPSKQMWPKDRILRALARSAVAEMHSGFSQLRNTYHTNFIAKYTGAIPISPQARKEVEKMLDLWSKARTTTAARLKDLGEIDDGYLFGSFSIADAFFWPVLWRFRSYDLPLDTATPEALTWMRTMWKTPALKVAAHGYFRQAERPETLQEVYEDIFKGNPDIKYGQFEEDWEFPA